MATWGNDLENKLPPDQQSTTNDQHSPKTPASKIINSLRFKTSSPIRFNTNSGEYIEYIIDSSSKTNKLAVVGDYQSKHFNKKNLISAKNYADILTLDYMNY